MERLELLMLSWLRLQTVPAPISDAIAAIEPALREHKTPAELKAAASEAVTRAERDGRLQRVGRGRVTLTDQGRVAVARELGTHAEARNWRALSDAIAAEQLGIPVDAIGAARKAVPALVAKEQRLPIQGEATEGKVRRRLVWRQLGIESDERITQASLERHLFARLLDVPAPVDGDKALGLLARKATGSRRTDARSLKAAGLRRFLEGKSQPATFTERVLAAARVTPPDARFGESKVYVSELWQRLRDSATSLEEFKSKLWSAHREGALLLARGDLVHLMDSAKLAESEIAIDHSTFHFVSI